MVKTSQTECSKVFQSSARTSEERRSGKVSASKIPAVEFDDGRYLVRFARNRDEIEAALRLRFEVFNLELGEGLESSYIIGLDEDRFDSVCHHLIVMEKESSAVVGTYRLQTLEMAGAISNFYCDGEFNLKELPPPVLNESLEIGRACVALNHRNTRVLFLLWKGLAAYALLAGKRYLFGCCSLTSQDVSEGWQAMRQIKSEDAVHPHLFVTPRGEYVCEVGGIAVEEKIDDDKKWHLPKLFSTYLRFGAKVCSPPAIDREFKTIDFFVMFDFEAIDEKTRRMFLD